MHKEGKKRFVSAVLYKLKQRYRKEMHTTLEYSTPWQLLVAIILSAQSQDAQVNKATRKLFADLPDVGAYSAIKDKALYPYIRTLGLYRSKAKSIIATAQAVNFRFHGRVPKSMKELLSLRGVGRKTANVFLSSYYRINEGIAIDTHCITVSNRLGLSNSKDPGKIEKSLMEIVKKNDWGNVTPLFIALGRDTCQARHKYCNRCVLNKMCPSSSLEAIK